MTNMNNLFEILTYFIIYSFLGWVMESTLRTISEKKLINTGFLHGPFCPIYGIGATISFLFLGNFENKIVILFFISVIVFTIWEYIVAVMLEGLFKTKYWDYSSQKFNFQGRVCLLNSIYWGVLGVLLVKYIQPFIEMMVSMVNYTLLQFVIYILFAIIIIDMITSIVKMKTIQATLDRIEKINKEIKEKLKEIRKVQKEKENTISIENMQKLLDKLKNKRNKTILHLYKNVSRMKKAFPTINTKEITEVLSKKIDIKNWNKKEKNK